MFIHNLKVIPYCGENKETKTAKLGYYKLGYYKSTVITKSQLLQNHSFYKPDYYKLPVIRDKTFFWFGWKLFKVIFFPAWNKLNLARNNTKYKKKLWKLKNIFEYLFVLKLPILIFDWFLLGIQLKRGDLWVDCNKSILTFVSYLPSTSLHCWLISVITNVSSNERFLFVPSSLF